MKSNLQHQCPTTCPLQIFCRPCSEHSETTKGGAGFGFAIITPKRYQQSILANTFPNVSGAKNKKSKSFPFKNQPAQYKLAFPNKHQVIRLTRNKYTHRHTVLSFRQVQCPGHYESHTEACKRNATQLVHAHGHCFTSLLQNKKPHADTLTQTTDAEKDSNTALLALPFCS